MKQIVLFVFLLLSFTLLANYAKSDKVVNNLNLGKSQEKITSTAASSNSPIFIGNWFVKEAAMYFQGWIRYYHYSSSEHFKQPRLFFQNDKYYDQRVPAHLYDKSDKYGEFRIPNKAAFFMVVKNETMNLYQERSTNGKGFQEGAVDGLNLMFIDHVSQSHPGLKGIKDFGEHKLGSCLEITAHIPKGYREHYNKRDQPHVESVWIICTDKKKDKLKILQTLIKLKVNIQKKKKDPLDVMIDLAEKKKDEQEAFKNLTPAQKKALSLPKDGYWVLLQDWTTCTLRCGGGWSYQHWFCHPPKNGGKPCKGEAIKRKPCNLQPCPDLKTLLTKTDPEVRKAIVQVRHFTTRPQRYSVCQVRENDAFLATYNPKTKIDDKRPVRVLMNDKTVSIYKDDSYHDLFYSYELKGTQILISQKTLCCFILKDNYKQTKLCGYPENCRMGSNLNGPIVGIGDQSLLHTPNGWAKSWQKDFSLFKTICKHGRQAVLLTPQDLKDLPKGDDDNSDQANMMKRKLLEDENEDNLRRIKKTTDLGFRAIQKENNLEQMIKNEEDQKGREELAAIQKQIAAEKKKLDCLHKNVDEKDIDFVDSKAEAKELKAKFQLRIAQKRKRMKAILENIRRKYKLKRNQLDQELKELKSKVASDLLRANYIGDIKKCIRGKKDYDYRDSYCNAVFIDSYITNKDCHSDEEWCEMCCQHEFGNLYIKKRYECYDICDAANAGKKDAKPNASDQPGKWMWTPKYHAGGDPTNPIQIGPAKK